MKDKSFKILVTITLVALAIAYFVISIGEVVINNRISQTAEQITKRINNIEETLGGRREVREEHTNKSTNAWWVESREMFTDIYALKEKIELLENEIGLEYIPAETEHKPARYEKKELPHTPTLEFPFIQDTQMNFTYPKDTTLLISNATMIMSITPNYNIYERKKFKGAE